jgi:anti-sigma28 factor (negative regulator of flagellin synthesis)
MSTRVHNDGSLGQSVLQTGRTDAKAPAGKSQSQATSVQSSYGSDTVQISSLSEKISAAAGSGDTERAGRIRQLSQLYASGHYHVDSAKIAHSVVEAGLGTAGPGKAS